MLNIYEKKKKNIVDMFWESMPALKELKSVLEELDYS